MTTLTLLELSAHNRVHPGALLPLLRELEADGVVEEVQSGRWRATDAAVQAYGPAFRALEPPPEGGTP